MGLGSNLPKGRLTWFDWKCITVLYKIVPGTASEGLNGWSEALTAGLAVWTAKTAKTSVTSSNFETQRQPLPDS